MSLRKDRILALFQKKLSTLKLDKISESDLKDPKEKEIAEDLFEALEDLDVTKLEGCTDTAEPREKSDPMYDESLKFDYEEYYSEEDDEDYDDVFDYDWPTLFDEFGKESLDPETRAAMEGFETETSRLDEAENTLWGEIASIQRVAHYYLNQFRRDQEFSFDRLEIIKSSQIHLGSCIEVMKESLPGKPDQQKSQRKYGDHESSQQVSRGQLPKKEELASVDEYPASLSDQRTAHSEPKGGALKTVISQAQSRASESPEESSKKCSNPESRQTFEIGTNNLLPRPALSPISLAPEPSMKNLPLGSGNANPTPQMSPGFFGYLPSQTPRSPGIGWDGMSPLPGTSTKPFSQPAVALCKGPPKQQPCTSSTEYPYYDLSHNPERYWQQGPYGAHFAPPPFQPNYSYPNQQTAGSASPSLKPDRGSTFYQPYL